jgi:hypothetical protein
MTPGIRYASRESSTDFLGRNHGRPRHRLVRTERARLGLADADAIESHTASALADERLIVERRWSKDHSSQGGTELRRWKDGSEARHAASQGDGEAQHGQADHGEAKHREAKHREEDDGQARRPQDDCAP